MGPMQDLLHGGPTQDLLMVDLQKIIDGGPQRNTCWDPRKTYSMVDPQKTIDGGPQRNHWTVRRAIFVTLSPI